ncbi:hypothetical protein MUN81_07750 [Hymenobacter sp. 5317J-9]|uniref:hypothetical protein n=1 Tax=Hymenobacter sp. 5317J-9 TaxID=2932250 RepID=UPI001FD6358A|nr:hypothetical protein [Hymenobacter sp. 5317J-9]UOQ99382.1 hypothetical protein MUN81_07750 [Hymenobacter sp. 5317J-9]
MLSHDATRASTPAFTAAVPARADASGVTSAPPPLVQPWLKILAVAALAIAGVALATAGKGKKKRKKGKNGRAKKSDSPSKTTQRTADGSYRAWYRDHPAGATSEPGHGGSNVQARADQRYSDSWSRKIETQYP